MKRRVFLLIGIFSLLFAVNAQAIDLRIRVEKPSLIFNGTTASCYAFCRTGNSTDDVDATLTLYQGYTYVDSWNDSGKGKALPSGTCTVESGKSYRLVLNVSVNGEAKPEVTTTGTCP